MPVTVNSVIAGAIAWVVGLILKRIPSFPNDMIPQITYYVSLVAAYIVEVLKQLGAPSIAHAAGEPPPIAPPPMDATFMDGSLGFILCHLWDWLGRKLILEKIVKKK